MQTYYSHWDKAEFGILAGRETIEISKSDFCMKLVCMVEAGKDTGYLVQVKRKMDGIER